MNADPNSGPKRLSSVDGLRGIAIVIVMGVHFLRDQFQPALAIGVDVFFVLSGFLITRLVLRQLNGVHEWSNRNFIRRRLTRIYPALIGLCTGFVILAPILYRSSAKSIAVETFAALTFTYPILAAVRLDSLALVPLWSLSVEAWFYMTWPVTLSWIYRNKDQNRLRLLIIWLAVASISFQVIRMITFSGPSIIIHRLRIDLLAIGSICALAAQLNPGPPPRWIRRCAGSALTLIMIVALLSQPFPYLDFHGVTLLPEPVARFFGPWGGPGFALAMWATGCLIWILFSDVPSRSARILQFGPLVWLGTISYSVYLWHYPIAQALYRLGPDWLIWDENNPDLVEILVYVTVCTALSLAVGWASYHWIERRFSFGPRRKTPSRP